MKLLLLLFAFLALLELVSAIPEVHFIDVLLVSSLVTGLGISFIAPYLGNIFHAATEDIGVQHPVLSINTAMVIPTNDINSVDSITKSTAEDPDVHHPVLSFDITSIILANDTNSVISTTKSTASNALAIFTPLYSAFSTSSIVEQTAKLLISPSAKDEPAVDELGVDAKYIQPTNRTDVYNKSPANVDSHYHSAKYDTENTSSSVESLSYEGQKLAIKLVFVLVPFAAIYLSFGKLIGEIWKLIKPKLRYMLFSSILWLINSIPPIQERIYYFTQRTLEHSGFSLLYLARLLQDAAARSFVFILRSLADALIYYKSRCQGVIVFSSDEERSERRGQMIQKQLGKLQRYRRIKTETHRRREEIRASSRKILEKQNEHNNKYIKLLKEEIAALKQIQQNETSGRSQIPVLKEELALILEVRQQSAESVKAMETVHTAFKKVISVNRQAETCARQLQLHQDQIDKAHVQIDGLDQTLSLFESSEYKSCLARLEYVTEKALIARRKATEAVISIKNSDCVQDLEAEQDTPLEIASPHEEQEGAVTPIQTSIAVESENEEQDQASPPQRKNMMPEQEDVFLNWSSSEEEYIPVPISERKIATPKGRLPKPKKIKKVRFVLPDEQEPSKS